MYREEFTDVVTGATIYSGRTEERRKFSTLADFSGKEMAGSKMKGGVLIEVAQGAIDTVMTKMLAHNL